MNERNEGNKPDDTDSTMWTRDEWEALSKETPIVLTTPPLIFKNKEKMRLWGRKS